MQQLPRSTQRIPIAKEKSKAHVDTVREVIIRTDTVVRVDTLVIFHQDTLAFEKFFQQKTDTVSNTTLIPAIVPVCFTSNSTSQSAMAATATPEPVTASLVLIGLVVIGVSMWWRGRKP